MKIAIILYRLNVQGGTQRQALSLAQELKRCGHEVTLYTFVYDPERCYGEMLRGLRVVSLDRYDVEWEKSHPRILGLLSRPSSLVELLKVNTGARKLAHLIDADTEILNPHNHRSYRVAYFFKKEIKDIPSVWMLNTFPLRAWSVKLKKQVNQNRSPSLFKAIFYIWLDLYDVLRFIRAQDKVLVLDERDRVRARRYFGKNASVIRSGLDLSRFPYRERGGLTGQAVSILAVALFSPHRRFEDLVRALYILKNKGFNPTLTVIGDHNANPDYFRFLQTLVASLSLESVVQFLGKVSDQELTRRYREADVFVNSNHLQSWGLAVFEAMSCGTPVAVSKSVGAAQVLTHGENALFIEPKSPESIAAALEKLIADPELYSLLSKRGRRFVEQNISWQRYTNEMLQYFLDSYEDF